MFKNRFMNKVFTLAFFLGSLFCTGQTTNLPKPRGFYPYSFGGLETLPVSEVVLMLKSLGYVGIAAESRGAEALVRLQEYLALEKKEEPSFKVVAAFMAHRFKEHGLSLDAQKAAIDVMSQAGPGRDLWVWFQDNLNDGSINGSVMEGIFRELVDYATARHTRIVLYPHFGNYFQTALDGIALVDKINHPSLGIAVNLTHELIAEKGNVLDQSFAAVKHKIFSITVSGAKNTIDRTSTRTIEQSTILSLDESSYDLKPFMNLIKTSGFNGPIGFINFKVGANPEDYLKRSITTWNELCTQIGLFEVQTTTSIIPQSEIFTKPYSFNPSEIRYNILGTRPSENEIGIFYSK